MSDRVRELFKSVSEDPSNRALSKELEDLLREAEDWASLVDLYVHLAQHSAEAAEASKWLVASARVAESELGDYSRALQLFNASLEGDPTDGVSTLAHMRALAEQVEDWATYVEVARAEAERRTVPMERGELAFRIGQVYEEMLDDAGQAVTFYQAAFGEEPSLVKALQAARRLYRKHGDLGSVAQLLDMELQALGQEHARRREVLRELSWLLLRDLKQPDLARQGFDELVRRWPGDAEEQATLAELGGPLGAALPVPPVANVAPAPVEQVPASLPPAPVEAEEEATFAASADAFSEPVAVEPVAAEPVAAEPVAAEPVAAEPVAAEPVAAEPVAAEPEAPAATTAVSAEIADLEARAAEASGEARVALLIEAVRALNAVGGGPNSAGLYLAAVRSAPDDLSVYWRAGQGLKTTPAGLKMVVEQLDALAEANPQGAAGPLAAHRILFAARHLDEDKGTDFKLRDLARKTNDDRVLDWQVQYLIETDKWRNVQQLLAQQAGGDPNKARLVSLRQMAILAEERTSDVEKATDFWRQVHQTDRDDAQAREALLRLYPLTGKWKEYAAVLQIEVDGIPARDVPRKIDGLRRLVRVYAEHLDADAQVVRFYSQILELDPDDADAQAVLIEKYEAMRKWQDLVVILQRQADRASGEARTALNLRIAFLYLDKFRNQGEAIRIYELVMAEDPNNIEAIQALDGMYEKRREWDKMVAIRRQLADLAPTSGERAKAYKDLADYATNKIRRPDLCVDLWEQVRSLHPQDVDALRALIGIYEQNKEWNALTTAVDELVDLISDAPEKVDLLTRSAIALQERVGDRERAVAVWQRLLVLDPENRRAGDALKKALIELMDWDALTTYFAERDKWADLVKILEGQVGFQQEDAVRIDLLFRSAGIWNDHVGQQDRAVRALERILQIEPENLQGARALEPVYAEHKDYRKLSSVLEILLKSEQEPGERRRVLLRLAELNEQHLRNANQAFIWLRQVVAEQPGDAHARAELERLGGSINQWDAVHADLVEALGRVAMADVEDVEAAQLEILLSLARILDTRLGRPDQALQRYHDALDIDADNRIALDAVEALYERGARWPDLLGILDRKLALADGVEARKVLLRKQGLIFQEQLSDPYSAIERFRTIVEEDASDLDALQALHGLHEAGEQWDDLHEVVGRELALATEGVEGAGDPIDLKMQLGLIELNALGKTAAAVARFQEILDAQPAHAGARQALEGLLDDPDERAHVARILEPIYQDAGLWEPLVRSLEIQLEETEEGERRIELLERIGTLHVNRTADIERAFGAFARMLREAPANRVALGRLTELAEAGQKWSDLATLLEEVVPGADETLGRDLLAKLAGVYEIQLGDVARAIDAHRRVLEIDAGAHDSIEALDRLYLRSEQWVELLAIYRRKLELAEEPEAREALRFQIAQLLEEMLGDAREAIGVYNEILTSSPENTRALDALARLYGQEEMWSELGEILRRQLALAEDEGTRLDLRVRLASLNERELGNVEQAIEIYREVLSLAPDNEPARAALERLIDDAGFRGVVADILEPIHERRDDWRALIRVYEIQREESEEAARKVSLLHKIALLHEERGGNAEEAFRSYARAFDVEPGGEATLARLQHLAESLGFWQELVTVYENRVVDIEDAAVSTDVHKRAARILLNQLSEIERARSHYEAAYEAADQDLEVIDALDGIYELTEQWHELVQVLLRRAELTEAVADKKQLYFRVSAIYEEMLSDPERAVEIYRLVLEADGQDTRALDALERIFTKLERWDDLIDVLQKKASLSEDLANRKAIWGGIGEICEDQLADLPRAVSTWQTILEWDANDLPALERLDGLFQRLEQWEDLHKVLQRQVEVQQDTERKLTLRHRIARLHEGELDDVPTAIEGYQSLLADRPDHAPTLEALEGLVRADREALAAAGVLEPVLVEAGAWNRLVAVWRDLLKVTQEAEPRAALLLRIGQAQEDMLLDAEEAFQAYGEAFHEEPTRAQTVESLERVARSAGMWSELVGLLETELNNAPGDAVARDIYLRAARIFEEELGSNVEAIERFRRVLEIEPEQETAILALDRLYQKEGMWADLADILRLEVERAEGEAKVPLLLRLGTLFESALEDVNQAIGVYHDVLEITPQQAEAVAALERLFEAGHAQPTIGEILEPLYVENEDHGRLHNLLQALLTHLPPGEDRMRAMHRLADLSLSKLGDKNRGFDWYGAAFREVPDDEDTRKHLAALAEETGRFEDLVVAYTEGLQNTRDLELIRGVSHEMATIYRDKLANEANAEQMYLYILDGIDPADVAALKGLDALYELQDRWPELVEILKREINATFEDAPRIDFMFRLGRVYEARLGEVDPAVAQYVAILDMEPHHAGALGRLNQIYQAQGQWERLFDVYARQAENAEEPAEKARLFASQAGLAADFLARPEDAIDLWNQVLEIQDEDAAALMALETLYQQQQSWRELVDVCERQVNLVQNDVQREIQLYAKLGRVWGDYLEREANALENWGRVLDRDPFHEEALWAVHDLYERTEDHEKVTQTNHRLLDLLAGNDARRGDLYRQLGRLYQEALDKPAQSTEAWTRLLALAPQDAEAIDSLEELYTQAEDWSNCVAILDRKVEITTDPYDRVSILFRIAEMWEQKLGDATGGQAAFRRVLQAQPENLDAFEALQRLYEQGMQWEDLVNLLLARIEQTEDLFERQELFERTARVFEDRLGQPTNAFEVLGLAFEESNDDERFGAELERLATATGQWAELIRRYETVLTAIGTTPQSVPIRLRVASWYDVKLEQAQHAGTHYQWVLQIEPDNLAALTSLVELLERYQNWAKVVEFLRRTVDLQSDPTERKASLEKLAGILEARLNKPDEAIEAWKQLLLDHPEDLPTLEALERLYATRQRWPELIDTLNQQASVLQDTQAIVENHLRAGELWENRLGSPERAIDAYNQALAADEGCVDAMQALEKLYTQQDRWHELLDVYEMMLKVKKDRESQLRILNRIAMLQEEQLSDRYATIDTYRRMVEVDPHDPVAVRALDRLYREAEQWDDLAAVYEQHLAVITDAREKVRIRLALAEILHGPLGSADRRHRRPDGPSSTSSPTTARPSRAWATSTPRSRTGRNCIDALSREAHLITERRELLDRQYRVGRIYQEKLGDLDQAERWYRAPSTTIRQLPAWRSRPQAGAPSSAPSGPRWCAPSR
jgi:tetratricopeptide (TPR) repeat protein